MQSKHVNLTGDKNEKKNFKILSTSTFKSSFISNDRTLNSQNSRQSGQYYKKVVDTVRIYAQNY